MYKKGEVRISPVAADEDAWDVPFWDEKDNIADLPSPLVFLPHSCGYWVIGGKEEVKLMIYDLKAALATLERMEE